MEISEQIDRIITTRKEKYLNVVEEKLAFYKSLLDSVYRYDSFITLIKKGIESGTGEYYQMSLNDHDFLENVSNANPSVVINAINDCISECERIVKRFSRDTINISVIGRARQGKSQLLQSISGVDNQIIPADDGGDCTGTTSEITNEDSPLRAEIEFYSEAEMIPIVQRYLNEIGIGLTLGSMNSLSSLLGSVNNFHTEDDTKDGYKSHLLKYIEHYSDYSPLFGQKITETNPDAIRSYVAQYDSNRVPTYKYLAVKRARIYTKFPFAEAGRINLVDTIGIGDTSIGIEDKMMSTLRDDSDAAILVRFPSSTGDGIRDVDLNLNKVVKRSVGADLLDKWLFFVLNVHSAGSNARSLADYESRLRNQTSTKFADIFKVNCMSQDDVTNNLMQPLLNSLVKNIVDVDNMLLKNANEKFKVAYYAFEDMCKSLDNVLKSGYSANADDVFDDKWKIVRDKLMTKLREKKESYPPTICKELDDQIKSMLKRIKYQVPPKEEICRNIKKGMKPTISPYTFEQMRRNTFELFDKEATSKVIELQNQYIEELCEIFFSADMGLLGNIKLNGIKDTDSYTCKMRALLDQVIKIEGRNELDRVFTELLNFSLSISGVITAIVNKALLVVDGDAQEKGNNKYAGISEDPTTLSDEDLTDAIFNRLKENVETIVESIYSNAQTQLLDLPNKVFWSTTRKMHGRMIEEYGAEFSEELKKLYRSYRTSIWESDYINLSQNSNSIKKIRETKASLISMDKEELFLF